MADRLLIEWEGASAELLLSDLDKIALRAREIPAGLTVAGEAAALLERARNAVGLLDPVRHEGAGKSDVLLRLAGKVAGKTGPLTLEEARRRGYDAVLADVDAYLAAGKPEDVARIARGDFSVEIAAEVSGG